MKEIWKDIPKYKGLYQVSNLGNVKALSRERINHTGGKWIQPEHDMATRYTKDGYKCVQLSIEGKKKIERIHRLVAEAFIPNPENKAEVNHKNCIRDDNRVENLEWVTRDENCSYTSKCNHKSTKQILCLETQEIFSTSTEIANKKGGDAGNIRKSARSNGYYSVLGFHYTYI